MLFYNSLSVLLAFKLGIAFAALVDRGLVGRLVTSDQTCRQISQSISDASAVIYAADPRYANDTHHFFGSSSQTPACVLEVGSAEDTAAALKIITADKAPFAVESGGHGCVPGSSSTTGVHISLTRMQQVQLSSDQSTVEIGTGITWSDAFNKLQPTGFNVVGGRSTGPAIGGFTLGGGFSWKTNQFGLTCDNVKSYNLVRPTGDIVTVDSSQSDLFFALKGGLNRFGIVTSIQYLAHAQVPTVYGGLVQYDPTQASAVLDATATFYEQNTDPKAQLIMTIYGLPSGTFYLGQFFYDGPTRPESFAPFDDIPSLVSTVGPTTFAGLIQQFDSSLEVNPRGSFATISTSALTPNFVKAVNNESDYWTSLLASNTGTVTNYDFEPFLPSYGEMATDSAYPHSDSPLPLCLTFGWTSPASDEFWYNAMKSSVATLKQVAIQEGIYRETYTYYPNYALPGTSAEDLYGPDNAARLSAIRRQNDPDNVMGLTGGFDF